MPQNFPLVNPIVEPFTGVVSGGRAVLEVPAVGQYQAIALYHTFGSAVPATKANFITNIASIQVNLGGTEQMDLTPSEIISMGEEKGFPWTDGVLPLWFAQPDSKTAIGQDITAWGMADINNFQIVVNFNAVTTPTLEGYQLHRDINVTNGDIISTTRQTVIAAGLTAKTVNIDFEGGRSMYSLYCMTDKILTCKAYIGNDKIGDATKIIFDYFRQASGDYDPQSDIFVFSAKQLTARYTDVISGANANDPRKPHKLRLEFGLAGSATDFDIIIEQIGPRKV